MPTKNQITIKKDEYLNKPHETIQIEGKLSLLQHKCWNILALHSIKSGLREGKIRYEIPLTLLYKYLQYKAENDTYLQQILVDIMHVVVQGNLINKKVVRIGTLLFCLAVVLSKKVFYITNIQVLLLSF